MSCTADFTQVQLLAAARLRVHAARAAVRRLAAEVQPFDEVTAVAARLAEAQADVERTKVEARAFSPPSLWSRLVAALRRLLA